MYNFLVLITFYVNSHFNGYHDLIFFMIIAVLNKQGKKVKKENSF